MSELSFEKAINPLYLYEAVQDQMRTSFGASKPSVLLLNDFFTTRSYSLISALFDSLASTSVSSPDRASFSSLGVSQQLRSFFASPAFFDFVHNATGITIRDVRLGAMRLGHRDFSLIHDDAPSHERFIFVFMMVPSSWNSSFGGSVVFSSEKSSDPLVFFPQRNSFALLRTEKGMRDFIKYINHKAGKEQVTYLFGEFLIR